MKIILTIILANFFAVVAFAQSAPGIHQAQAEQAMPSENPPTPSDSGQMENPKYPKQNDQSSGAIVRKHDTPVTLDPAKHKKLKKSEKKTKEQVAPKDETQKSEQHIDTTESTD